MADTLHNDLLQYYKRELSYLRGQGADFASRYPKVASRLALHGSESIDPIPSGLSNQSRFSLRASTVIWIANFRRSRQPCWTICAPRSRSPFPP